MSFKLKPLEWFAAAALTAVAIFFWHKNYFIQDDAYIAFVYAKNFAEGHGLVWYPGLDEYGYTNFLYTLLVGTVMFWLPGVDPEYISAAFNFTAYLAALALTFLLTLRLTLNFSPRMGGVFVGGDKATLTRLAVARHPLPLAGEGKIAAACAVLTLATHHTFSAYASGGLETMVVTALVMGFYFVLLSPLPSGSSLSPLPSGERIRVGGQEHALTLAILASAALLTRLDSAILLFPGYVYLLYRHCEEHLATKQSSNGKILDCVASLAKTKSLWLAAGIPTLCVLALLSWAKLYYGYALPNTFYAKIPGDTSMVWLGQRYILKYLELHHYIPAVLLGLAVILIILSTIQRALSFSTRLRGESEGGDNSLTPTATLRVSPDETQASPPPPQAGEVIAPLLTLLATIGLWLAYVVYIGGCFMEFRLLVPILPMFAAFVFAAVGMIDKKKLQLLHPIVLCIIITTTSIYGNQQHSKLLARNRLILPELIEPTFGLNHWMNYPQGNWRMVGKSLKALFGAQPPSDLLLAITASGAAPFYSDLHFLDVHGINRRTINGENAKPFDYRLPGDRRPLRPRTGHRLIATDDYMISSGVTLNLFHPHALCPRGDRYVMTDTLSRIYPMRRHRTVLLPLNNRCYLYADYITHHPRIEELLANGTILDYRTNQDKFNCPRWLCLR
ncbi:MAG: hypothetical protein SFW63_00395 [Alphaproteobacteria bacterium]|nr:hypothetical protein [Alphaproteobacteria bacterium]